MLRAVPKISSLVVVAAVGLGACQPAPDQASGQPPPSSQAPAIVQPGAPGQASTVMANVPKFSDNNFTDDDVKFIQGMIHHHSQALLMVKMIGTHTKTPELGAMGQKIQLSQSGEIQAMKEWLTSRKQEVPMLMADGTVMDHGDMPSMPGMLTADQMKKLDGARNATFDELFLTGMIQHHKGALKMVVDLREAGGGKEPNIGDFLNEVDNDQRMEIVRMYGLLGRPVEWK
ncbi:MAG: DUF305 domain-containing protein [Acidobacteria bacterium]|nr:DUF305 domain-containing protein [Acidobacteriota bacterium]